MERMSLSDSKGAEMAALPPAELVGLYRDANKLIDLGRLDEAEALHREVLARDAGFAGSLRGLAQIARRRGDSQAALLNFRAAAAIDPNDLDSRCNVANELIGLGQLDEAEALHREVLARDAAFAGSMRGLAHIDRQRGDNQAALEKFLAAAALVPMDLTSRSHAAEELISLGRLEEAEALHREVLARDAAFAGSLRGLARIARQRGDNQAAVEHFRSAARSLPGDFGAMRDFAQALRIAEELDEAEKLLNGLLLEDTHKERVFIELAQCAHQRGDRESVFRFLKLGEAAKTQDILGRIMLAREFLTHAWAADAERIFAESLGDEQYSYEALIGLGNVARRRGNRGTALAFFRSAAAIRPIVSTARVDIAIELRDAGEFVEAKKCLEEILAEAPANAAVWLQLGYLYRMTGDRNKAREVFRKVVEMNPGDTRPLLEVATEEFHLGNLDGAQALLKSAHAIQPNSSEVFFRLGEEARIANQPRHALDLFRRAAKTSHKNFWPSLNVARCLAELGRSDECFLELEQFTKKWGRPEEYFIIYSELKRQMGDLLGARAIAAEGKAEYPTSSSSWRALVMLEADLGAHERAQEALNSFSGTTPSDLLNFHQAAGYLAILRHQYGQARRHFSEMLAIRDCEAGYHYRAAQMALLELDLPAVPPHLNRIAQLSQSENQLRGISTRSSQSFLGQLLMEFLLDAAALSRLKEARTKEPQIRLDAIRDVVESYPHYTPAAMSLVTELRIQEKFIFSKESKKDLYSIPLNIVQYWDSPDVPKDIIEISNSWINLNGEYKYIRFSKETAHAYLKIKGMTDVAAALVRANEPAMQADVFRLAYLFQEGGFYADADDRCLVPLSEWVQGGEALVLYQEDIGSIGNNFIGARPANPVIGLALRNVVAAINRGDSDLVWLLSGPGLLTRALATHLSESPGEWQSKMKSIRVLDRHELLASVAIHCLANYKHTALHWSKSDQGSRKKPLSKTTAIQS